MNETTNLYSSGYTQKLFVEPEYSASLERGGKRRCLGCMHLYDAEFDVCPNCGYTVNTEIDYANILNPGTILNKKYMVGKAIAINDFCATYLAWDTELRRRVAINEYLPAGLSLRVMNQLQLTVFPGEKGELYEEGLERFVEEYKFLSNLRRERAISTVFDIFEENRTAYAVRYNRKDCQI
jgi:RNA polymerase subunit RPABC4/transcription elongation factor Spt4